MKIKNLAKYSLPLLLAMLLVMSRQIAAFAADSGVTFENGKLEVSAPGSVHTDSNLFDSFQNVMPGDKRSEEISIQNSADDCDFIKVYLRAVLHDETKNPISGRVLEELRSDERRGAVSELEFMYDFLSTLALNVTNGDALIYEDSPDRLGGLTENVYLGTIRRGEAVKLDVELSVPVSLGNEYGNRIGEVDWVFVVEGFDDPEPPPDDDTMLTVRKLWSDNGVGRPDSVTIQLLRNGTFREEIELNQNNQWAYTWNGLDNDYEWSVVEARVPDGYEATCTTEGNTTTITNTKKKSTSDSGDSSGSEMTAPADPDLTLKSPAAAVPVSLAVVKQWTDNEQERPESVKITLYDGETAVESVWLGAWNNWTYQWNNLYGDGSWQVLETEIPSGYTPSYASDNGVVTVTNTATLIQTGQINWPVAVLGVLGLVIFAAGLWILCRKKENE